MKKVITYGTYDLLHYGHIRLLKRAKALGDYLIVGVTSDDFDRQRGKINVHQSLEERIAAVRETGIADQIIVEEYEGQKIDDIKRYGVDIFTVGSDWKGYFDYLKEYCQVIYLDRTEGISSTELRSEESSLRLGLVGYSGMLNKIWRETKYVNGLNVTGVYTKDPEKISEVVQNVPLVTENYDELLDACDAVYIHSHPTFHYDEIKHALINGKHVLCESPIALSKKDCHELFKLAEQKNCILMESIKTAYATAYSRLLLLLKGGKIGKVTSVDATCTSLRTSADFSKHSLAWNGMYSWAPTGLLPVFQILGIDYRSKKIISRFSDEKNRMDEFTRIRFLYPDAVASVTAGIGVKSEGALVISGTKGYVYVPAPWWKTDYFEIRYENPEDNRRYFYQLDGEGIRYELVEFSRSIEKMTGADYYIDQNVSEKISEVCGDFLNGKDLIILK